MLLQEIIDGATAGTTPVSTLLRSVQVLAARTGARDLEAWVRSERDGYKDDDAVPTYRGPIQTAVMGQFSGPFGSVISDLAIPRWPFVDNPLFEHAFQIELRQPMTVLEDLVSSGNAQLAVPWVADMTGLVNGLISSGKVTLVPMHNLVGARRVVPRSVVLEVVDTVRNRVLDLSLQLEQAAPQLQGDAVPTTAVREQISAAYHQTIVYAEQAYLGQNIAQTTIQITPGDTDSLDRYLAGLAGLSPAARAEIVAVATEATPADGDGPADPASRFAAVRSRIGQVLSKAGETALTAAVDAAVRHWMGG